MIEQLLPNPLFRNVSAGELRKNFEGLTYKVKNYTKGEILAHQGDVCNKLVILTKGSVRGEATAILIERRRFLQTNVNAVLFVWI